MVFPHNFEEKIGFSAIRAELKALALSDMGREYIDVIAFETDFENLKIHLQQTEEFRQILLFDNLFPAQDYIDMRSVLSALRIVGTFIEQENLFDLKTSLLTIYAALDFLQEKRIGRYPALETLCKDIHIDKRIIKKIDLIIDDKGQIRDNASERLQEIRKEKASKERAILGKIRQALASSKEHGYTEEGVEPTVREGRLVIPVLTAYKRSVSGFIHDESSSGRITYIEPSAAFELNNEIRDLINAEKREIIKILTLFTDTLRPEIDMLMDAYHFLGLIDFIRAKAAFAVTVGGVKPIFQSQSGMDWIDAVHPLLYLLHRKQNKPVVPLTVSLNEKDRILVISGPNAGGKSICLKTIGLLQYMWQCGLLVPMKENSVIGMFNDIFIDIGDQQSLENDLSTYSSHLLNMKHFMEHSDNRTLFLIDEFGTGTEPNLGGAIAEAVLENLNQKRAYGVVTTHYANLKLLPDRHEGIVNGAMLFDIKELKPTFRLRIGKPGSSFAFEIAKKIGFPEQILTSAEEKSGTGRVNFDQQLQQLDIEKEKIEKGQQRLAVADEFLSEIIEKYEKLNNRLEGERRLILQTAKSEAKQIVDNANRLIEKTIREIKESQAEKEKTKHLRQAVEEYKEILDAEPVEEIPRERPLDTSSKKKKKTKLQNRESHHQKEEKFSVDLSPINIRDFVRLQGTSTIGEVTELKGNQAFVAFDSVAMRLETNRLEKIKNYMPKSRNNKNLSSVLSNINERKENFNTTLDLRGVRTEDALQMADKYLDEAVLLSVNNVRILHGKGNGILRTMIRGMLSKMPRVESFEDEQFETGGTGITIVKIK